MSCWAVIVAAGRGERFGADRPKAFIALAGRPLLAESLDRLDRCDHVDAIVVVAPKDWEEPVILLAEELGAAKVSICVTGGASRAASVRNGVAEVADDATAIVVHDAARPLVSDAVVERVLEPLRRDFDGAVPGLPLADTVKRVDETGTVVETVDRTGLYAVQTPQAFVAATLRRALAAVPDDATDCAGIVEKAGGSVCVVEGDPALVKITTPVDLVEVENLLREARS